jgi:hypothetical protein
MESRRAAAAAELRVRVGGGGTGMSNNTYLLTTAAPDKPRYGDGSESHGLLVASTSIPVFWYMLFNETSLVLGPGKDESKSPYLHLTTLTTEGLARAQGRWPTASAVIGSQLAPLFQTWLSFVREHALGYVHCETAEWSWMFDTPEAFEAELRTCLHAVGLPPDPSWREERLPPEWNHLLGQAHVGFGRQGLEPLGNLSYCGGSFGLEAPWSEEVYRVAGVMSDQTREAPAFGAGPDDLQGYMKRARGPIHEYRQSGCSCGGTTFRLQIGTGEFQGVVRRQCADCGRTKIIGGLYRMDMFACSGVEVDETGEVFWQRVVPMDWMCAGCGSGVANVGVGFEMGRGATHDEPLVDFMDVGVRCVTCGRMGSCSGWEECHGDEMFDEV